MARSGTSLLGQFIKTSPEVVIFPEMNPANTPAIFELLSQVRRTLGFQSWRPFSESDVEARIVELLRHIWGSGRDWDVHDDSGQPRFGLKQPNAEELHEEFAEVLGDHPPQWVYAIRNPADVYDSTMRMEGWGDYGPEAFHARYDQSLRIAHKLYATGDLFVFDVDRTARDPVARKQQAADLFSFLDLEPTPRTEEFLEEWPTVNTSAGKNRGSIPDEEIARRVAQFSESDEYGQLWGMAHNLREAALGTSAGGP